MALITLIFIKSEAEITYGIPETVVIASSVPATIYFTLDGTIPTEDSAIYIDELSMPYNTMSITLNAFAIDGSGNESEIFTELFAADMNKLDRTHILGSEGNVVDRFSDPTNIVDGFDADGNAAKFIDKELVYLDPIYSDETKPEVIIPPPSDTPNPWDDNFVPYSTPEHAHLFNPYAKVIVIDGRVQNDIKIINRPFGSITTYYREQFGKKTRELGQNGLPVSGGFVKTFYSAANGIMVSYYYDNNEERWVKSIQNLPAIPAFRGSNYAGMPLVFKWIYRGRHSTIV